jgi:hypothetical protein
MNRTDRTDEQILDSLSYDKYTPTTTLVSSLKMDRTALNSRLYTLLVKKKIQKRTNEKGGNPEWILVQDHNNDILDFITSQKELVSTLSIAKHIFGPKATASMINPYLYRLEKEGSIYKTANADGSKPRWSINTETEESSSSEDEDEDEDPRLKQVMDYLKKVKSPASLNHLSKQLKISEEDLKDIIDNTDDIVELQLVLNIEDIYYTLESLLLD